MGMVVVVIAASPPTG